MDDSTKISELKNLVQDFCEVRDWDQFHSPKDLAIGISTEASEILEHFRFKSEEESKQLLQDKPEIAEELADVFFFILRFSQMYNIDISDELKNKIVKNNKKYPAEISKGSNKKYTELER